MLVEMQPSGSHFTSIVMGWESRNQNCDRLVEQYAALELLYLNPKQASFNIVHQNLLRQSFNSGPIRVHLFP